MSKYEEIINLSPPKPKNHKPMTNSERASQFAPFAALTGFGEMISSSRIIYDEYQELDGYLLEELNKTLSSLRKGDEIEINYFEPVNENSGEYIARKVVFREIDLVNSQIILKDRTKIKLNKIYKISKLKAD